MVTLEYLAGYFDGEGYVGITKESSPYHPGYKVEISITNTYLPILLEIQEQFGGHVASWSQTSGNGLKRPGYSLRWTGKNAKDFLAIILPYLREKRMQAEIALSFPACPRSNQFKPKCADEVRKAQENAFLEVRRLKKIEYQYIA